MISLRYFVLVLLTLCGREWSANSANDAGEISVWAIVLVVAMSIAFALVAKLAAITATGRATLNGARYDWLAREYFIDSRIRLERIWCFTSPLVILLCGWSQWTCQLQAAGWPQALMLAFCFAPTLMFLLLTEVVATQMDRISQIQSSHGWLQTWKTRIRLGELSGLLTCLTPVLLLAGVSDLSQFAATIWGVDQWIVSIVLTSCLVALVVLLLPDLLTSWSGGQALNPEQYLRVSELVKRAGIKATRPAMIGSQGRWAGAAVVGWVPGFRRLWLGDGLLNMLSSREVDMVVMHELAHISRFHFFWRLLPVIWSMGAGAAIWLVAAQLELDQSIYTKLLAGVAASWLMLVGLGGIARRCELDADSTACVLAHRSCDWVTHQSPAEVLSTALGKLLEESPADTATWLHPSLKQRQANLAAVDAHCRNSEVSLTQ